MTEVEKKFRELEELLLKKFKSVFGRRASGAPCNWRAMSVSEIEDNYVRAKDVVMGLARQVQQQ